MLPKKPKSKATFPVKRKAPLVVHLGNVGLKFKGEIPAQRTKRFADRFKGFHFLGIDLRQAHPNKKNWTQIKTDMLNGLKELKNNSVSLISSEMAIGYYEKKRIKKYVVASEQRSMDYALEVLKVARKKLKKGGRMVIVIDLERAQSLVLTATLAGFKSSDIKEKRLRYNSKGLSFWTGNYSRTDMVAITIEKK